MKIYEIISESLNQPYPHKVVVQTNDTYKVRFTTSDGYGYFEAEDLENYKAGWKVNFSINDTYQQTGTGDQYRIFATIMDIAEHWISEYQPEKITFSADKTNGSSSRSKLYSAMANKFAQKFGYHWQKEEEIEPRPFGYVQDVFTLVKNGSS